MLRNLLDTRARLYRWGIYWLVSILGDFIWVPLILLNLNWGGDIPQKHGVKKSPLASLIEIYEELGEELGENYE